MRQGWEQADDMATRRASSISRILFLVAACVALLGAAVALGIALIAVPVQLSLLMGLRIFVGPAVLSIAILVVGLVVRSREEERFRR